MNYEDKEFDKFLKKQKCSVCKKEKAMAIIRTKPVCKRCFYKLNKDNKLRIKENINITKSLKVFK